MSPIRSIDSIVVGVRDIEVATELWVENFGLDVVFERFGNDVHGLEEALHRLRS